jgi:hypothetical protein
MLGLGSRFDTIMRQNVAKRAAKEETQRMAAQMQAATALRVKKMGVRAAEGKMTLGGGGGGAGDIGAMARTRLQADVAREQMSTEKEIAGKELQLKERQGWAKQTLERKKLKAGTDIAGLFAEEEPEEELLTPKKKKKRAFEDKWDYLGE